MFAFIKTHKTPIGIRPVVERTDAPTFLVEKALAKWARGKLKGYEWSLTSSRQFIDALFEVGLLPNEIMEVYDYEALVNKIRTGVFTAIPYAYRKFIERRNGPRAAKEPLSPLNP